MRICREHLYCRSTTIATTCISMNKYAAFNLVVVFFCVSASGLNRRSGDISSGGGDALVMAFTIGGQKTCEFLRKTPSLTLPVSTEQFCEAVYGGVTVSSDDVTILDGIEVDAINTPDHRTIVLSQKRNKPRDMEALKRLAVHEYLAVLGVDDTAFKVSGSIADALSLERDYFPLRYCTAEYSLQAGSGLDSRVKDRSFLKATFTTDFSTVNEENLWLDFSGPLRFRFDGNTGEKISPLDMVSKLNAENTESCRDLKDQFGIAHGKFCLSYRGPKDILKDYLTDATRGKTMLQMRVSKLRSLETVTFINPGISNPEADFSHAKGYIDSMGFRGSHLSFSKKIPANEVATTKLKSWGSENVSVNCY